MNQEAKLTRTRRPFREHATASHPRHALPLRGADARRAPPTARHGVALRPRCPSSFDLLSFDLLSSDSLGPSRKDESDMRRPPSARQQSPSVEPEVEDSRGSEIAEFFNIFILS
jgi:hypothetical protein